ncbi:hypothetical protein F2Q70_00004725 [Brassica cretica]|uniref:Uncharacterized protein n=1 Tax=Brassica cretica TaxID=69181 RepID=A0A8S9IQL0_BRACR|nr:hypothetical protein F2Q68_00021556 [Brassica cretica]KAF2572229.1 hypothetical protein F2Q70_00004725 [Brassica cretica]
MNGTRLSFSHREDWIPFLACPPFYRSQSVDLNGGVISSCCGVGVDVVFDGVCHYFELVMIKRVVRWC